MYPTASMQINSLPHPSSFACRCCSSGPSRRGMADVLRRAPARTTAVRAVVATFAKAHGENGSVLEAGQRARPDQAHRWNRAQRTEGSSRDNGTACDSVAAIRHSWTGQQAWLPESFARFGFSKVGADRWQAGRGPACALSPARAADALGQRTCAGTGACAAG